MAVDSSIELVKWILKQKSEFDLSFVRYDWTRQLEFTLHDYQCEISFRGERLVGRGTDTCENSAIVKATAEVLERAFVKHNRLKTTNGVAFHTSELAASRAAKSELLERDSFMTVWLTGGFLVDRTVQAKFLSGSVRSLISHFLGRQVQISLWSASESPMSVFATASGYDRNNGIPFGFVIGGSWSWTRQSVESACLEVARSAADLADAKSPHTMTINDFYKKTKFSPRDHDSLALNPQNREHFAFLFEKPSDVSWKTCPTFDSKSNQFEFRKLKCPPEFGNNGELPGICVQAKCPNLQDYFVGPAEDKHINSYRIPKAWKAQNLTVPHPFG